MPSEQGQPPSNSPHGLGGCDFWRLSGLGSPKSRYLPGLRIWRGYKAASKIEKYCLFAHSNLCCTLCQSQGKVFLDSCGGAWRHTRLEVKFQALDYSSYGYYTMCPTLNWRQKYLRPNWWSDILVEQRSGLWSCVWLLRRGQSILRASLRESKCSLESPYISTIVLRWNCVRPSYLFADRSWG